MDGGDSPSGGFWRRLKKKVAEPFVVGRKVGAGSNSPSRDNSLEVATQRYREAHEEENNKTRIKDIIRRDLLFYPTFRNALQGNSERTESSLRYAELYERYKDLYAPLLYDDPEDDWSNVGDTDREDSLFLAGEAYDPKRAASMLGSRQTIPSEVAEADLTWAKNNIEVLVVDSDTRARTAIRADLSLQTQDKEIADELCKMQKKMRDRNEIYVLLTAAKRQVGSRCCFVCARRGNRACSVSLVRGYLRRFSGQASRPYDGSKRRPGSWRSSSAAKTARARSSSSMARRRTG